MGLDVAKGGPADTATRRRIRRSPHGIRTTLAGAALCRGAALKQDSAVTAPTSLRLWLFAFYLALYLGFMLLTAFGVEVMASTPFGGVNLAILYGLLLIVAALVLALFYMWRSRATAGAVDAAGASR